MYKALRRDLLLWLARLLHLFLSGTGSVRLRQAHSRIIYQTSNKKSSLFLETRGMCRTRSRDLLHWLAHLLRLFLAGAGSPSAGSPLDHLPSTNQKVFTFPGDLGQVQGTSARPATLADTFAAPVALESWLSVSSAGSRSDHLLNNNQVNNSVQSPSLSVVGSTLADGLET